MSDGPHKSLNMPSGWRQLAERADNKAFAPEEVRDALPKALEQDWHAEVPDSVLNKVGGILDNQNSLFGDQRAEQLEALRGEIAGYPLGSAFLDHAIQATYKGISGPEALREAVSNALSDRAARGARQVEEHYYRKSVQGRAAYVRERIETGVTQSDMASIAGQLVGTNASKGLRRPAKQIGLDDGVRL